MTLEEHLHDFLKAGGGKHYSYEEVKYQVEKVWLTSKGGHYRMETLTRRARKDNTKENDIASRIGKEYRNGPIVSFYYKTDSLLTEQPLTEVAKEFCCIEQWHGAQHNPKCFKLKLA